MKTIFLLFTLSCAFSRICAQRPADGIYMYKIAFAEWGGKSLGSTCTVIIKGNHIKVLHNGKPGLMGKKGEIIDQGIIMKHSRTGHWIIGHHAKDKNAKEVGGCSEGPSVIDFKHKQFWLC